MLRSICRTTVFLWLLRTHLRNQAVHCCVRRPRQCAVQQPAAPKARIRTLQVLVSLAHILLLKSHLVPLKHHPSSSPASCRNHRRANHPHLKRFKDSSLPKRLLPLLIVASTLDSLQLRSTHVPEYALWSTARHPTRNKRHAETLAACLVAPSPAASSTTALCLHFSLFHQHR